MLALCVSTLALLEPTPLATRPSSRTCAASSPFAPSAAPLSRRALLSTAAFAAAAGVPALPALAESTLVTRQQAYTRYVPRIERGRDFWQGGLRKMVANQDWDGILRELEPVGKNKGGAIAKTFGPLRLWASSWSGKTVSDKTVAMNEAVEELSEAASSLEIAALGKEKDTGFGGFFGAKKSMDPANRSKLAQLAYKKGVLAFNKYLEIGNDGLGLSFQPIDLID